MDNPNVQDWAYSTAQAWVNYFFHPYTPNPDRDAVSNSPNPTTRKALHISAATEYLRKKSAEKVVIGGTVYGVDWVLPDLDSPSNLPDRSTLMRTALKRLIQRRYPGQKGFENWGNVAKVIAKSFAATGSELRVSAPLKTDLVLMASRVINDRSPVYWVDPQLAKAFFQTNLPATLQSFPKVLPSLVFMLPDISELCPPDGERYTYLIAEHWLSDDPSIDCKLADGQIIERRPPTREMISISAMSENLTDYIALTDSLSNEIDESNVFGGLDSETLDWLARMRNLAYQCLLYLSIYGDSTSTTKGTAPPAKRKMKAKDIGNGMLSPRWIGKGYKPKYETQRGDGTHASPATHWRKGHWRSQPWGPGLSKRKMQWIEPVLVNAEAE